jgi:hypothetical protein
MYFQYAFLLHEDIIKMKNQKSNVNAMWTHFQTKLEKSIDVNVPKQIARKKDGSPWITPGLRVQVMFQLF